MAVANDENIFDSGFGVSESKEVLV